MICFRKAVSIALRSIFTAISYLSEFDFRSSDAKCQERISGCLLECSCPSLGMASH